MNCSQESLFRSTAEEAGLGKRSSGDACFRIPYVWTGGVSQERNLGTAALGLVLILSCEGALLEPSMTSITRAKDKGRHALAARGFLPSMSARPRSDRSGSTRA